MTPRSQLIETTRAQFRGHMPVAAQWAYFDHAAVAPLPSLSAQAICTWCRECSEEGDTVWPRWSKGVEHTRSVTAAMIGADPDEIALVPSTTAGINIVAEGLDWRRGDNIVSLADEFPSNAYPWLHLADFGVEARRIPTSEGRLDLDDLATACDERTRLVSVSWIGFASGYRHQIDRIVEIAHRSGALMLLDAIQGLGAFPIDVRQTPIDFLAADGHKWMLGPEGAGIAYIRRENLDRLRPIGVGWNSVVHGHDFSRIELDFKTSAARYEGGSQNMAGFLALGASLQLLGGIGIDNIGTAILEFTDRASIRLQKVGARILSQRGREKNGHDPRSGIVSFDLPGRNVLAVRQHCLKNKVALACRNGRLRISAHGYNNSSDLDKLIDTLKSA